MPPPATSGLLKLLRPRQSAKNLVCLSGAFFSGHIRDHGVATRAVLTVVAFCAVSSFVYIINDIFDRERDRQHPRKQFRPIASGAVSVGAGLALAAMMLCIAAALGATLGPAVLTCMGFYIAMNICYSAFLKNLSLVDATIVAAGFILRIYAGTSAVHVSPSAWLLLCTFFLSLFLAFGKRRAELYAVQNAPGQMEADAIATRGVLHKYSVTMLDRFCNISATLTIATYASFTVLAHPNRTLVITTLPVVLGIFRYLLLVERYQEGESPDIILTRDWPIQLAIVAWVALYAAVMYFGFTIDVI